MGQGPRVRKHRRWSRFQPCKLEVWAPTETASTALTLSLCGHVAPARRQLLVHFFCSWFRCFVRAPLRFLGQLPILFGSRRHAAGHLRRSPGRFVRQAGALNSVQGHVDRMPTTPRCRVMITKVLMISRTVCELQIRPKIYRSKSLTSDRKGPPLNSIGASHRKGASTRGAGQGPKSDHWSGFGHLVTVRMHALDRDRWSELAAISDHRSRFNALGPEVPILQSCDHWSGFGTLGHFRKGVVGQGASIRKHRRWSRFQAGGVGAEIVTIGPDSDIWSLLDRGIGWFRSALVREGGRAGGSLTGHRSAASSVG